MNSSDEDMVSVPVVQNAEPVIGPLPDAIEAAINKPLKYDIWIGYCIGPLLPITCIFRSLVAA